MIKSTSWQDAAERALTEASRTIRDIEGFDVLEHSGVVRDGEITEYQTHLRIRFRINR